MLTLKSMPTVEMKLPARNAPSLKRTSRHVFPTPESPTSITCTKQERKKPAKIRFFLTVNHKSEIKFISFLQTEPVFSTRRLRLADE